MPRTFTTILLILLCAVAMRAAECDTATVRPVMKAYTIAAGASQQANTYLSPLKYDGFGVNLDYERWQAMRFDPHRWVMRLAFDVDFDRTQNPARNASMWYGGIRTSWGMMRRWHVMPRLTLGIGPATSLTLGCLYNDRNGNNPAAAKAAWMVGAQGYATYKFTLGSLPVIVGYHVDLPLTGAFFSPDYGELYYEIYLGDYSGLAHWGWWGNYFTIDNRLTADLQFGGTWLRIGLDIDYETTCVNHITTRSTRLMGLVGISGEWMSINPRKPQPKALNIISAY